MRCVVLVLLGLSCTRSAPPPAAPPTAPPVAPVVAVAEDAGTASDAAARALSSADAAVAQAPTAEAPRALYYERALTAADLEGRSLRELALLRNTPYARRGHTFRRPWLRAYFQSQAWYHPERVVRVEELSALDRANLQAITAYDLGLSHDALVRMRDALLQRDGGDHLLPGDDVEAVLLATRLGERVTLAHARAVDPESTPLDDPARLDTLLSLAMLRNLSRRDLRIIRTMVRSRRGQTIRNETVRMYFDDMGWYHPDPTYSDARLTRTDRQNLRLIQTAEAEGGGPLPDAEVESEFLGGA
ncbi:MAG: YARHG domain-containing protein [Deltaproteobacteria bacterium]|nr:YARHG domain-containing protein [Deltaproteobacteria bacterium]